MDSRPPIPTQPYSPVDPELRVVIEARRLATRVAAALVRDPFDEQAHTEFQEFLAHGAEAARAAWQRLNARSEEELSDQVRALLRSISARTAGRAR